MGIIFRNSFFALYLVILINLATGDFIDSCPEGCSCEVSDYRGKVVSCINSALEEIPKTLSAETQWLDLSENDLKKIPDHIFEDIKLSNLNRLIISGCKLRKIENNSLKGLSSLKYLSLSINYLKSLPANCFQEIVKIKKIQLSHNQIERLEDGVFSNLPSLKQVDLSYNAIFQIGKNAFMNVPNLSDLLLHENKIKYLDADALNALTSLAWFSLHNNSWHCDCNLKPFMDWVISKKDSVHITLLTCMEPVKFYDKAMFDVYYSNITYCPTASEPVTELYYIVLVAVSNTVAIIVLVLVIVLIWRCLQRNVVQGTQSREQQTEYTPLPTVSFDVAKELVTSNKKLGQQPLSARGQQPPSPSPAVNIYEYAYAAPQNNITGDENKQQYHIYEEL